VEYKGTYGCMPYCACENNEWKTKGWPDILKNAPVGCEGVICGIAGEWTLPHRLHGVALSSLLRLPGAAAAVLCLRSHG